MKYSLVVLPSGKEIPFNKEKIIIGRGKKSDIIHSNRHVSNTHCVLFRKGKNYFIDDLKSSNGTFINGNRIHKPVKLYNNDTVSLGQKGAAFQFRKSSTIIKKAQKTVLNPKYIIPAVIGLILITALLVIYIILKDLGRIDTEKELLKLQKIYGMDEFPDDHEFLNAIDRVINIIRNDVSFPDIVNKRKQYLDSIESILDNHNVPRDFSFIAWVESNYDPSASNWGSGARGMWQLMPATARQYGLQVNNIVDERLDPEKCTQAAALYIKDLISIFGRDSFLLVIAAYNAGDGAILYSLKQIKDPIKDRSFWYLYKNNLIPEQTKQYVIKIIALIILKDYY